MPGAFPSGGGPAGWNVTSRNWCSASIIWHVKSNGNSNGKPHCDVCPALPFQLLRERLRLLPVSCQEPYHPRKKLSQEEIRREVIALQDMGHKRLALEAGEDPRNNPIDYILESIRTIYSIHHKNGAIRRVNVNIAATTVEKLSVAERGRYRHLLSFFQET